jgi:hypothetical protein
MRRFIDNSYLHSVGNCLARCATSLDQVETFARFLGEILIAERFIFTADRDGPVMPLSETALEKIDTTANGAIEFEYIQIDEQRLSVSCAEAANHIVNDVQYLSNIDLPNLPLSAHPNFKHNQNPHISLHEILTSPRISWRRKLAFRDDLFGGASSANIAPRIILSDRVISIIALRIEKQKWHLAHTLYLAVAARMLTYDSLAGRLSSTYLPSSGRAAIHRVKRIERPISIAEFSGIGQLKKNEPDEGALLPVVAAIINVCDGDPVRSLKLALNVRKETERLRKELATLQQDPTSDACLFELQRFWRDYQDVIDGMVKGNRPPPLTMALKPSLVFFGIPSISVDIEKLGAWLDYKRKAKKVRRIAAVFLHAQRLPHNDPLELLRRAAIAPTI